LMGDEVRDAAPAQPTRRPLEVGRLAAPVQPLEGDEPARHGARKYHGVDTASPGRAGWVVSSDDPRRFSEGGFPARPGNCIPLSCSRLDPEPSIHIEWRKTCPKREVVKRTPAS